MNVYRFPVLLTLETDAFAEGQSYDEAYSILKEYLNKVGNYRCACININEPIQHFFVTDKRMVGNNTFEVYKYEDLYPEYCLDDPESNSFVEIVPSEKYYVTKDKVNNYDVSTISDILFKNKYATSEYCINDLSEKICNTCSKYIDTNKITQEDFMNIVSNVIKDSDYNFTYKTEERCIMKSSNE